MSYLNFNPITTANSNTSLIKNLIIGNEVVYASPRGSSGGFRSGSFKSSTKASTSSGFKSGSFTSTPKSTVKSSSVSNGSNYSSSRSFIPIPIFGHSGYSAGSYIVGGFMSGFVKLIFFLVIIIVIIRIFRKRRY